MIDNTELCKKGRKKRKGKEKRTRNKFFFYKKNWNLHSLVQNDPSMKKRKSTSPTLESLLDKIPINHSILDARDLKMQALTQFDRIVEMLSTQKVEDLDLYVLETKNFLLNLTIVSFFPFFFLIIFFFIV